MKHITDAEKSFEPTAKELVRLLHIMAHLRSPNGCPWDLKQSSKSLRPYLIEETFEVIEAIEADDPEWLCEELGDLLLQIVFHAQIHSEDNSFDMSRVIRGIADKMERRHPHVFGDLVVKDDRQIDENWERIKQEEKSSQPDHRNQNTLPPHLPALLKAQKFHAREQLKATHAHKDAPELPEQLNATLEYFEQCSKQELDQQLPALLFALTRIAELKGIDSELSLRDQITKHLRDKFPSP